MFSKSDARCFNIGLTIPCVRLRFGGGGSVSVLTYTRAVCQAMADRLVRDRPSSLVFVPGLRYSGRADLDGKHSAVYVGVY